MNIYIPVFVLVLAFLALAAAAYLWHRNPRARVDTNGEILAYVEDTPNPTTMWDFTVTLPTQSPHNPQE